MMTHYTQRVLEGRQIRTLQDMMDYCAAALSAARSEDRTIQPDEIELRLPQDMRLLSEMQPDRSKRYFVGVQSW
jgi:hypothetical protein